MEQVSDNIPDLAIEHIKAGAGAGLIRLTQDSCGNVDAVAIHPIHLRHMAEMFGLVPAADMESMKTIATMRRHMLILRNRIDLVAGWLGNHRAREYADLNMELVHLNATVDLANEFTFEFDEEAEDE